MIEYFKRGAEAESAAKVMLRDAGASPSEIEATIAASNVQVDHANELANYIISVMALDNYTAQMVVARLLALFIGRTCKDEGKVFEVTAVLTSTIYQSALIHYDECRK